jgi:hypothetical protein
MKQIVVVLSFPPGDAALHKQQDRVLKNVIFELAAIEQIGRIGPLA